MTGPVTPRRYAGRMARNTELIRQWEILRDIDAARNGISAAKLASLRHVHPRTIRRDLQALARAGFPLYDDKSNGTSMWKLRGRPFRALDQTGLGLTEICALYLGHTMMRTLAGSPLLDDAERAMAKIERALPRSCRAFLDGLPGVIKAKGRGRKKGDDRRTRDIVGRILDAFMRERRCEMRYAKPGAAATRYVLDPHRMVYADGGLYLLAFVPAYGEIRTFAVERMETFALTDEAFTWRPLPAEPFAHSLGVHTGAPERVVLEFTADAAPYVRERDWHPSQRLQEATRDGGVVLTLDVCVDYALRAWILGFGAAVRVVQPVELAQEIFETAHAMRRRYQRELRAARFEMIPARAS
jgi:predicted DNA-binding transcriptional regulator YafY